MGDDDTFFSPFGLAALLSKYDHKRKVYVGSYSETHFQNIKLGYEMAFGGGGFAISAALAEALNSTLEECLIRNNEFWSSDQRVATCVAELGVKMLKKEQ